MSTGWNHATATNIYVWKIDFLSCSSVYLEYGVDKEVNLYPGGGQLILSEGNYQENGIHPLIERERTQEPWTNTIQLTAKAL